MPPVSVTIISSEWSVNFIGPDGQTRVGPWLLFDSHDEVKAKVLAWGNVTAEELKEHERSIAAWGVSTVHLNLTDHQFRALIRRGIEWPWNGYELIQMKRAGKYPPARTPSTSVPVEIEPASMVR